MSESIPERLRAAWADRYELQEELGSGGMATVPRLIVTTNWFTQLTARLGGDD